MEFLMFTCSKLLVNVYFFVEKLNFSTLWKEKFLPLN